MPSAAPPAILDAVPPRADRRVALWSILGFWVAYYVLNTARMAIAGEENQIDMLPRRAAVTTAGILLSLAMYAILRRLEGRSMRVLLATAFLTAIPASIIYACCNYTAFYLMAPNEMMMREVAQMKLSAHNALSEITELAVSWYFFIAAWGVLYVALSYAARMAQAERQAARYRSEAQVAQLRALRYQVNPHFLFNTLNSLSALVLKGHVDEAERMITSLATFFRTSLTSDATADLPLSDEIEMQKLYLGIEQVRFPARLKVVVDVPDTLANVQVPSLILQPLVENAIKHGVARSGQPVTVTIRARREGASLHLSVEDDARETDGTAPGNGTGVGLTNVRQRLVARFDGAAHVAARPRGGGGFKVEVIMPLSVGAGDASG
jgi:signal transduction histidine kinase